MERAALRTTGAQRPGGRPSQGPKGTSASSMKRLLLVLAFTLALAAPATAHAALKYSQAVAIAEATWPGSPCPGQEEIFRRADGVINSMDAIDGIDSAARAEPWNCTVYLRA